MAAVVVRHGSLAQSKWKGPPLGPAKLKGKGKQTPVTRLKTGMTGVAKAVAEVHQLPARLEPKLSQLLKASPPTGGDGGGSKEGWRPRWNNSWGDGIAWWNLLANAELMTPIGRKFLPDPDYKGEGLSPPQHDPLCCHIDNVVPFDQALLEAREKAKQKTMHSQRVRAKRMDSKGADPPIGSVSGTPASALPELLVSREVANDSSIDLGPFIKEQQRLRLLNVNVTVDSLVRAHQERFSQDVVPPPVLDVGKLEVDEAPPWDEDDEAFNNVNYIDDAMAESNRKALAELKARELENEQQRTYESDISDSEMCDATMQARMRMFGDKIGYYLNLHGGVGVGVGCTARYLREYPGEVAVCFQIVTGLWYEVRMSEVQFFKHLENHDYEADDFVWGGGRPQVLHREAAKRVFERYDLTTLECAGDNELLTFSVTDLLKISNWVKAVKDRRPGEEPTLTDAMIQLEHKEYVHGLRQLHAKVVGRHAVLKQFESPKPKEVVVISEGGSYQEWLHDRAMFNKPRQDEIYNAWLEWVAPLNKPRPPTLLQKVKGSVLGSFKRLSSWMNEEVEISFGQDRKDVRSDGQGEVSDQQLTQLNLIARAIVEAATAKTVAARVTNTGTAHDDEYDLAWLESLGVSKQEVLDLAIRKVGVPRGKFVLSSGGVLIPRVTQMTVEEVARLPDLKVA